MPVVSAEWRRYIRVRRALGFWIFLDFLTFCEGKLDHPLYSPVLLG